MDITVGLYFNWLVFFADEKLKQKKARFERFNRAPPIAALNGGRMTRTQEARIEEVKQKKKKGSKKAFKGSTFKGRKKTKKVQKGKKIQAAPTTPTTTKTKAGNEPKITPEVEQAKSNRNRNRNRTVVERIARESGRIKRSTAFYGLPSEMPEKTREISPGNGSDSENNEVHKIVQQIMDYMLEKVEKASQVLNEAEKMNLDLSSAKTEQKKRRSSTDSISIQISNQSELVEEIVDLFKAPAATTSNSEVVGKEKKTESIRIFENSRQIKARGSLSGGDQQNEKYLP